jgi:hypothetical protein
MVGLVERATFETSLLQLNLVEKPTFEPICGLHIFYYLFNKDIL